MNRVTKFITLSALIMLPIAAVAKETPKDGLSFATTEVASGIYMISGVGGFTGGNIAVSVGDDGVVMIDDSMPPLLDRMKAAIKAITDSPVNFLINTHIHPDHTGNNESMGSDGTRIVAHENLRINMLSKGMKTSDGNVPVPASALPVITFSEQMSFHLNGEDVRIIHVENAHTDGDAIIHYENANVIHTGDAFFNGLFPYIDLGSGGSVEGYIAAQQKILSLSDTDTKIIPGHGPLGDSKQLMAAVDMLVDAKILVGEQIAMGKTEDEVVAVNPLVKYEKDWSWGFITTEKMTRQVYKSLSK